MAVDDKTQKIRDVYMGVFTEIIMEYIGCNYWKSLAVKGVVLLCGYDAGH